MVGGGHVAQRRVPQLIAAGADVVLVSPEVTPSVEGLATAGEITWHQRGFEDADLDGAWYVIAATDDTEVNEAVTAGAERRRVFCVRADDATRASAWTPAVGRHAGVTVAVLGNRDPRRSAAVRDEIVEGLREGTIVARHQRDRSPGVVLVGGGPGDPELISVAGRKALMEADVVVADRLAPRELLGELPADVELIDVAKLPRGRAAQQDEINRILVDRVRAGKRVVRFKGGDSFVFGRGFEEVEACRAAGVPVTVVPGLTSPIVVPALAGIPVTHRGVAHDFTVISGHLPPGHPDSLTDWDAVARLHGTLLLMMAVENAPAIADALLAGGRGPDTPVAMICDGSMPGERTVLSTLGSLAVDLAREAVQPPAIIVVGDVVAVARPEHYPQHHPTSMAELVEIGSADDPRLADYRDLRDVELRKHLEAEHGLFLAEGEKVVRRAVEAGHRPRSFLMAPRWLDGLSDVLATTQAPCYVVSEELAEEVTGFHVHRGALASLERRPLPSLDDVLAEARSVLVLEEIVDHTNVGAIFRSGAALGFDAVLLAPRCADPLYRRSVKVAMGAVFALPWTRLPDWHDALPGLSERGFTTVALTLADDAVPVEQAVAGVDRLALVLGSEGHGLSPRWEASADRRAIIPMAGGIDSLNVAAATAVACYVAARRQVR